MPIRFCVICSPNHNVDSYFQVITVKTISKSHDQNIPRKQRQHSNKQDICSPSLLKFQISNSFELSESNYSLSINQMLQMK